MNKTAVAAPAIEMVQVRKVYPPLKRKDEPVTAIEDISFTVARGEFVSVVGPSGCGKSTLIKMLAGLLPITSGEIRLDGNLVTGPHDDIGIVFQNPVLLKWRSVLNNVLFLLTFCVSRARSTFNRRKTCCGWSGYGSFETSIPACSPVGCSSASPCAVL